MASSRSSSFRITLVLVLSAFGAACSSASPSPSSDGGAATTQTRKGYTECGGETCNPGSYCDVSCRPGCASVTNCAESETCEKSPGDTTGSCKATGRTMTDCAPMTGFDSACSGAGLPPRAYKCSPGGAAPQPSCVAAPNQTMYPGGWCCPT